MTENGKVLFIVHDLYQDDIYFPIGVGYLAAVLKKTGSDVQIYSQDVFHYSNEQLAEYLKKEQFDLIGLGFLAARFNETIRDLCVVINRYKKNAWLVLGGHGPSPIPDYILRETEADIIAIGEAEETILELLKCKLDNLPLSNVRGIAFRQDNKIIINDRRKPIQKLDSIPFPEWSLFPMENYITQLKLFRMTKSDRVFHIITSRGCINRCNFCYRMEKGIRFRSIKNVVEEITQAIERYKITFFQMNDELFIYSKKGIFEFRDELERNDTKIKFTCNARVDVIDEELAQCLKDSGCQFLNFGMESSDQSVLDNMNKNTTVQQNIQAAEIAKKMGIGLGLNFIWGNIGDSEESLKKNVQLIKKYNTFNQLRTIRPVTPYPGSDLYYEAIKRGLLKGPEDFFKKFKNSDLLLVNFTDIPKDRFYNLLFNANKELILDHFSHTTKDMISAIQLINDFHSLYFREKTNFRGSRHYVQSK